MTNRGSRGTDRGGLTAKQPNRRVNTLLTLRREARKPNGIRSGDLVGGLRRPPAATTASAVLLPSPRCPSSSSAVFLDLRGTPNSSELLCARQPTSPDSRARRREEDEKREMHRDAIGYRARACRFHVVPSGPPLPVAFNLQTDFSGFAFFPQVDGGFVKYLAHHLPGNSIDRICAR